MDKRIVIMEKPEWVSWNEIHDVLQKAHAENRAHGINMRKPSLPGSEIEKEIGSKGKMFVAMDGDRVVGTSSIVPKQLNYWCDKPSNQYACKYFASVLPEYAGCGIFKQLDLRREKEAIEMGLEKMLGDTHENNKHLLDIIKKNGYRFVDYKHCGDHNNVIFVKWLNGCPYSRFRCWYEFNKRKYILKLKLLVKRFFRQ